MCAIDAARVDALKPWMCALQPTDRSIQAWSQDDPVPDGCVMDEGWRAPVSNCRHAACRAGAIRPSVLAATGSRPAAVKIRGRPTVALLSTHTITA
ncbi:hypothetical protein [Xanthomonas cassavae]|uniref:hypothetical protein n=1 Tax=Xanthomonas cassavae TaxID=56450 RepID=UPI0012696727|nr:hypothetical protein [Xanthomonas cassavae]